MAVISLDVYHLINRMNRTEKAYFKKFGYKYDKGAERQEFLLFNVIEKELKKTDEVLEQIEERVIQQMNLKSISKLKTNLYHDLLATLREYEKSKVIDEKIFEYYQFGQILIKRNLFKEALAYMKKAENLAKENELYELEVYMAHQYAVLLSRLDSSKDGKESVQKLEDAIASLKILEENVLMEKNYFELVFLQKTKGVLNAPEDLKKLESKAAEVKHVDKVVSAKGRLYQLESLATIEILQGNQQASFANYEQIIQLLDEHPFLKKRNLQKYIILSEQYMQMSLLTLNIAGFEERHANFLSIECENELEQSWKDNADIFMLSIYAILNKNLASFDELEDRFNDLLKRIPYLIPGYRKVSIAYYMVSGFFMQGDFDRTIDWFYFIQNNRQVGVRHDVDFASRIMMIIACFEKKEYERMDQQLKAFRNFIAAYPVYDLESILSSLFGRLLKEVDSGKRAELYQTYLDKLVTHFELKPKEKAFLGVFDIECWLISKLNKGAFYELWCQRNLPK